MTSGERRVVLIRGVPAGMFATHDRVAEGGTGRP
jgi:hypothetical protein